MESEFQMIRMIQDERQHVKVQQSKIPQELIFAARKEVSDVKVSDEIGHYIVDLIFLHVTHYVTADSLMS